MDQLNNIHVIVAPSSWTADVLQYRRHQLARFLKNNQGTNKLVWITADTRRGSLCDVMITTTQCGIEQWLVNDVKSLVKFNKELQFRLIKYVMEQSQSTEACYYLWYTYPAFASLASLEVWDKVIYDCSDYWIEAEQVANPIMNKLKRKMITRSESEIVKSADICFASSKILQKRLEIIGGKKVTVIENGVDYQHFNRLSTEAPTSNVRKPTLGFIGGLKPWKIDFKLLLELCAVRPDWHLVIVGPFYGEITSVFNELIQQSNVTHLGEVSYDQAPEVIRTFDVGLLPYLENEYNQGVFPLKLYEYLACGKPVVGCGLPSTVHCQSEGVYEHVKNDLEAFAAACDRAMRMANQYHDKRKSMASSADWQAKFDDMWTVVNTS